MAFGMFSNWVAWFKSWALCRPVHTLLPPLACMHTSSLLHTFAATPDVSKQEVSLHGAASAMPWLS